MFEIDFEVLIFWNLDCFVGGLRFEISSFLGCWSWKMLYKYVRRDIRWFWYILEGFRGCFSQSIFGKGGSLESTGLRDLDGSLG